MLYKKALLKMVCLKNGHLLHLQGNRRVQSFKHQILAISWPGKAAMKTRKGFRNHLIVVCSRTIPIIQHSLEIIQAQGPETKTNWI